jgi:hypothetical protein
VTLRPGRTEARKESRVEMRNAEKNGDAEKRRFLGFYQDRNVSRRFSMQICPSLSKKYFYKFFTNEKENP